MDTFKIIPEIKYGNNSLECLKEFAGRRIFIVTDPFIKSSGLLESVTKHLKNAEYTVFDDVVPDPPIEKVVHGVDRVMEYNPDVILALGGGSAIDEAKAIMYFAKKIGNMKDVLFVAIPTTSGTGSEVTSFAVITDREKGVKYPLVSDLLLPDMAVLSAELVKTVPQNITADTGMDVLTHALEAYVSAKANVFSDALAEKAVSMVFEYLVRSYKDAQDSEARENMHYASCIAGLAFNIASLGLNHAMAHNIGAKLHIPHGRTNAILLPHIIEYNSQDKHTAKKYARLAKFAKVNSNNVNMAVKGLISAVKNLERELHLPVKFENVKADSTMKNEIAVMSLKDACILTNPVKVSEKDVIAILNKVVGD